MRPLDQLEQTVAEQEKRAEAVEQKAPRAWLPTVIAAAALVLVLVLAGAMVLHSLHREQQLQAQAQAISELVAQVESYGGQPVVTVDPATDGPLPVPVVTNGVDGKDGQDGQDSTVPGPPSTIPGEDGTDGTNGTNGEDGEDGTDGQNGADGAQGPPGPGGVGIAVMECTSDGEWVVTMTDGTVQYPGACLVQPGPQEPPPDPEGTP